MLGVCSTRISYDSKDKFATIGWPAGVRDAEVLVDPDRSFGQPIFGTGGVGVVDVMDRFWAGEDLDEVADGTSACLDTTLRTWCVSHPEGLPDLFFSTGVFRAE